MLFGDSPSPGLVGIAKLAAQSDVLEAKRIVQYFELESRTVLNRTRPDMPFEWSLNPYRGCEFGCRYCYARYTHEFMELRESVDFEDRIYAKSSIGPILRQELKRIRGGKAIGIGTATDPYQPAERRFHRTRQALEVFAEHTGLALSITTKSDLVTRDIPAVAGNRKTEHRKCERDYHDARYQPRPYTRTARATPRTAAQSGTGYCGGRNTRGCFSQSDYAPDHRSSGASGPIGKGCPRPGRHVFRRRRALPDAVLKEGVFPVCRKTFPSFAAPISGKIRTGSVLERAVPGNYQGKNCRDSRQVRARRRPAPPRSRVVA